MSLNIFEIARKITHLPHTIAETARQNGEQIDNMRLVEFYVHNLSRIGLNGYFNYGLTPCTVEGDVVDFLEYYNAFGYPNISGLNSEVLLRFNVPDYFSSDSFLASVRKPKVSFVQTDETHTLHLIKLIK